MWTVWERDRKEKEKSGKKKPARQMKQTVRSLLPA